MIRSLFFWSVAVASISSLNPVWATADGNSCYCKCFQVDDGESQHIGTLYWEGDSCYYLPDNLSFCDADNQVRACGYVGGGSGGNGKHMPVDLLDNFLGEDEHGPEY